MKTAALAFRYLWSRPLAALLNLLLLTLGLASITFVLLASEQVDRAFQRDLAGIDAVVGAKGSPMQLILAGVFHIDVPPGNIPLAEVRKLAQLPLVRQAIPISLGDAFRGFRIVGTTPDYVTHYRLQMAEGALWRAPMEAVVGAQVASAAGLRPGAAFAGSHGLGGGSAHAESPYRVTGVLAPCGCVVDRLVLTSLESVWHVHAAHGMSGMPGQGAAAHADHGADADTHEHDDDTAREVTMALITYRSPLAAVSFPRYVNSQTGMQAAAPALEISRLLRLLGVGTEVLQGIGAVLLLTGALSVFVALWTAVRERSADLAMLRMLGATPAKVGALLLCEALWLAVLASVLGLAAGHGLTALVAAMLRAQQSLPVSGAGWVPAEAWIPVLALAVAGLAALIPAIGAARVDVGRLLNAR
ncbi:ABC transporter permease [Ramlibacter sp.]|uniref:ABC transporter permease n=1 Tax=Ramlibacter sp. TaxID=1917967 RepID=UPI00184F0051|nr:ABC transporter permease [Ramlibacter sp.]MBA2673027.1 ABC transporter permease [Ramlibacter sp.]